MGLACINAAVIGSKSLAKELGKRGTSSDFDMYNLKKEDKTAVFLEPTLYPDKVQPLLYCLGLCDFVIFAVEQIDKNFAECTVAIDLLGKKDGIVAIGANADEAQVKAFLKGTLLEKYEFMQIDAAVLREKVMAFEPKREEGTAIIPIDHSFMVKSVGAVVLGVVARGNVKKHQELELYPTGKKIIAKSLQVHDEDVELVETGARIGIAVKGSEAEELERGFVLAEPGTLLQSDKITVKATVSRFSKDEIAVGTQLFISAGMQFIPSKVEAGALGAGKSGEAVIKCDKPLVFRRGEKMLAVRPDSKGPRVFAALEVLQ